MFSYQFHIRDYLTKTRHLSHLEDLAYRRLIDAYYTEEEPLPADVQACARLIAMREHAQEVEAVLREFFSLADDGWHNARCDQEIARYRALQESGRRSAARRWKGADGLPMGDPSSTHKEPNANPMLTKNHEPETKKPKTTTSGVGFDWSVGDWTGIDEARKQKWREAHGVDDVDTELKKAALWVLDNPDKPKDRYGQFLSKWMSKAGGTSSSVPKTAQPASTNVFEGLA